MNAIVLGNHVWGASGMNKRDEQYSLCNLYLFFGLFYLAATPYHVIPCKTSVYYSSIYLFIRDFS